MDYSTFLYGPIFVAQGVPAVFDLAGLTFDPITVLDKTTGLIATGGVDVGELLPGAVVRMVDLAGATVAGEPVPIVETMIDEGAITLNGQQWKILSHWVRPSPYGAEDGQCYLRLEA